MYVTDLLPPTPSLLGPDKMLKNWTKSDIFKGILTAFQGILKAFAGILLKIANFRTIFGHFEGTI